MKFSLKGWGPLIFATSVLWGAAASGEFAELPNRETPRPVTTDSIPHIQLDVEPVPEVSVELLQRVSKIPGIDLRGTIVGRSGSTGFWLNEAQSLARPDAIIRGREFAHLHPDGSLHASLPPQLAVRAVNAGWAIPHPWAAKKPGLEGFVMIYTPASPEELKVVVELIKESYNYVTGKAKI